MDGSSKADALIEIGKPIAVDLADGSNVRGYVHAYDKASTLVCLEVIPSTDVILLSMLNVKSITPLNNVKASRNWLSNPTIDAQLVRAEEERECRKRHSQFMKIGVGVTPTAQNTFDLLEKTLPCKWDHDVIVILDSVRLSAPYDVNSISGNGDGGAVSRVKMILENESKAIKDSVDTNGLTPT